MAKPKDCCDSANDAGSKLVKATDLPLHGNPYPPKDVVIEQKPGIIETKVASIRVALSPYLSPIGSAFEKTSDIVSVGVAHSQSTMQRLAEQQSSMVNVMVISGAGFLGFLLARRGIFKRLAFASVFMGGATVACYPNVMEEKGQLAWYIAKNKLPDLVKQQYTKFTSSKAIETQQQTNDASDTKANK